MMSFFDLVAPVYDALHIGARKTARTVAALAEFKPTDRVLDLGGGTGRVARFFVGSVASVTVADPSEKMLAQCKRKQGLACVLAEAEHLPFADASFEKVIIVDAFHHFANHERVIAEVRRVLVPGGRAILEEFNIGTFAGKFGQRMEWLFGMQSHFFTPPDLAALWQQHGFTTTTTDREKKVYYLVCRR